MKIENEVKLTFDDVLIRPKRSTLDSRGEIDLEREIKFKYSPKIWKGIPLIASNMDTVGTIEMGEELQKFKILTALHKFYKCDDYDNERLLPEYNMVSIGQKTIENLDYVMMSHDFLMIDVANGYRESFVKFVSLMRDEYPLKTIIAGNVCTREMTEALILAGADIIKIGIGPGSVCTTRKITGVGYPQLSAISECADAAHGLGAHIIADGGCKDAGDIAKAFGAGADFVMLGGMLAGHTESGGEMIKVKQDSGVEKCFKIFYGMSSHKAHNTHYNFEKINGASEGKVVQIEYKGPVGNTINEILGGLRSTGTYIGAKNIKDFPKCTTFVKVTQTTNNVFNNMTISN